MAESKEERLNRSWEFLTDISNKFEAFTAEDKDRVIALGTTLNESGMKYIHIVAFALTASRQTAKSSHIKITDKSDTQRGKL